MSSAHSFPRVRTSTDTVRSQYAPNYTGYVTDEGAFLARIEKDATSFQPIGKCIHSYARPAPSASSGESNVEYEVYHVRSNRAFLLRRLNVIGYLRRFWFQGISQENADIYTAIYRGWLVYQRRGGWVGIRGTVSDSFFFSTYGMFVTIFTGSKSGSGRMELRRTILLVIHRCITSTVSQKKCGCD